MKQHWRSPISITLSESEVTRLDALAYVYAGKNRSEMVRRLLEVGELVGSLVGCLDGLATAFVSRNGPAFIQQCMNLGEIFFALRGALVFQKGTSEAPDRDAPTTEATL